MYASKPMKKSHNPTTLCAILCIVFILSIILYHIFNERHYNLPYGMKGCYSSIEENSSIYINIGNNSISDQNGNEVNFVVLRDKIGFSMLTGREISVDTSHHVWILHYSNINFTILRFNASRKEIFIPTLQDRSRFIVFYKRRC